MILRLRRDISRRQTANLQRRTFSVSGTYLGLLALSSRVALTYSSDRLVYSIEPARLDAHQLIESVQRSSRRAAAEVHREMQRGLGSLAIISATAPLIGFFGTVLGILNSCRSYSGAPSYVIAFIAEYLSEALIPALLGLFVSLTAFWIRNYLTGRLDEFDLEMENSSADLLNRLTCHPLRVSEPAAPSRPLVRAVRAWSVNTDSASPRLIISRMFRHGVLQLAWPRLESSLEADSVLWGAARIAILYGLLAWIAYSVQGRPMSGLVLLAFFSVAAMNIRIGSIATSFGLIAFLIFASVACAIPYGGSLSSYCFAGAPLLLIGSLKAAASLDATPAELVVLKDASWRTRAKNKWERLQPVPNLLAGLFALSSAAAVLFGTMLAFYSVGSDNSMEPTLHQGDYVI